MCVDRFLGGLCHPLPSTILFAYRYEWIVQAIILLTYLLLNFATPAPGCERFALSALAPIVAVLSHLPLLYLLIPLSQWLSGTRRDLSAQ
jgi:hypothetical protein